MTKPLPKSTKPQFWQKSSGRSSGAGSRLRGRALSGQDYENAKKARADLVANSVTWYDNNKYENV